jgi:hypothetical protein
VRTTVDIEERILARAKRHAAKAGLTLSALVSNALASYMSRPAAAATEEPFELIVRGRHGDRFPSATEIADVEAAEDLAALRVSRSHRAAP